MLLPLLQTATVSRACAKNYVLEAEFILLAVDQQFLYDSVHENGVALSLISRISD